MLTLNLLKTMLFIRTSLFRFNPHTNLQKNSHFQNLRGPADPKNCMSWYKRYGFQGSVNYSWSNAQSFLGSARTPKIRMRVKVEDGTWNQEIPDGYIFIDREAGEVIRLVASVCPSIRQRHHMKHNQVRS